MQCGTPVVAAAAGAIPEVCGDAALLVDPDNSGAWRAAIGRVIGTPDLARDLHERGRRRAAELSWAAAGERLWSCLLPFVTSR